MRSASLPALLLGILIFAFTSFLQAAPTVTLLSNHPALTNPWHMASDGKNTPYNITVSAPGYQTRTMTLTGDHATGQLFYLDRAATP